LVNIFAHPATTTSIRTFTIGGGGELMYIRLLMYFRKLHTSGNTFLFYSQVSPLTRQSCGLDVDDDYFVFTSRKYSPIVQQNN
jgi:hypothetical protein